MTEQHKRELDSMTERHRQELGSMTERLDSMAKEIETLNSLLKQSGSSG